MTGQRMPPQKQSQPGRQHLMEPAPDSGTSYRAAGKLEGQVALVSGCDSQPEETATGCVFLAANDPSYVAARTLHPNGGQVVNG